MWSLKTVIDGCVGDAPSGHPEARTVMSTDVRRPYTTKANFVYKMARITCGRGRRGPVPDQDGTAVRSVASR